MWREEGEGHNQIKNTDRHEDESKHVHAKEHISPISELDSNALHDGATVIRRAFAREATKDGKHRCE